MNRPMRLFQKRGVYYYETERGCRRSLRTKDPEKASRLFKELERLWLRGRLIQLEDVRRITLLEFRDLYSERAGVSAETLKLDKKTLQYLSDVIGGSIELRNISKSKIEDFKKACRARNTSEISIKPI